jgi:protein SCO1/2
LIDKNFNVRGFYNGLDSTALGQLARDISLLMLEKSTNPQPLPFDPVQMLIFFAITFVVVITVVTILFRKKQTKTSIH